MFGAFAIPSVNMCGIRRDGLAALFQLADS